MTKNPGQCLWESILPERCLETPPELARVDALLDDAAFFEPYRAHFDPEHGRRSTPIETYLRMMLLKSRYSYRLSYEVFCREVADSISWRRFCRRTTPQGVEAEALLVDGGRVLLVGVGVDEGGVDVDGDAAGCPARRPHGRPSKRSGAAHGRRCAGTRSVPRMSRLAKRLAPTGAEPATCAGRFRSVMTGQMEFERRRSPVRAIGIEFDPLPATTRHQRQRVELIGLEPTTPCMPCKCSSN